MSLQSITKKTINGTRWYQVKNQQFMSVTSYVDRHFPAFNADKIIQGMKDRGTFSRKYKNMTVEDVKAQWDMAATMGTELHDIIESSLHGKDIHPSSMEKYSKELAQYNTFMETAALTVKDTEWTVWSKDLKLAGTIDALFHDSEGNTVLVDWKRSASTKYKDTLDRYMFQTCLYSDILKRGHNINVHRCMIVAVHPEIDTARVHVFDPYMNIVTLDQGSIRCHRMITYTEFIQQTGMYIQGYEYTSGKTFLKNMRLPGMITTCKFRYPHGPEGLCLPLRKETKILHEHLTNSSVLNEMLKSPYVSVDQTNHEGQTLLMEAAAMGCTESVKILMKYNPSIDAVNMYGMSALHSAIVMGHEETAQALVTKKTQPYMFKIAKTHKIALIPHVIDA